jgi:membrane protease YdiL (CAAX protease family)
MPNHSRWLVLEPDLAPGARIAAVAEPGFVLIAGTLIAGIVLAKLGTTDAGHYLYDLATPDFRAAAWIEFVVLSVRFGIVVALAVLLGWLRGRASLASYGISLGDVGSGRLVGIGVVLGLIASLPGQILHIVNVYAPLGPGTKFWELQARVPWDVGFWLYMAVSSFLVVPVFEELYTRGYLLGRIRESFSAGGAMVMMAAFFTLAHGQYHQTDPLAIGQEASIFVWALCVGYAVLRTGSLLPGLIAHAMTNVPLVPAGQWAALAASFIVLVVCRKAIASWLADVGRTLRRIEDWPATLALVLVIAGFMFSVRATPWMIYLWLAVLGSASVPGLLRRSPWAARH